MDSSIKYSLVRDQRISDLSDKIEYGVEIGASENTAQVYNANTSTSSLITFNVVPPSESTAIDRHVLLRSTLNFRLRVGSQANPANLAVGTSAFQYGLREGFAAFPVSQAMNTATISFNNTSISVNMRDTLPSLLHMMDQKDLQMYQGMTPVFLDNYQDFVTAIAAENNNPLAGYTQAGRSQYLMPRGVHPISVNLVERYDGGVLQDNSLISTAVTNYWVIECSARFTEPLFVSPMVFGHARYNCSAFLGINRFNMTFNMGDLSRSWCTGLPAGPDYSVEYVGQGWSDSEILMNFLSLDQTFAAPSKIVLPFLDYDRYETLAPNSGQIAAGATREYTLNAVNLDKVPDKLLFFCRKPNRTVRDPMAFFPIIRANITFANGSGRLSSFQQQQLYQLSVANGLQMNWYSFSGKANSWSGGVAGPSQEIPTCGSILAIDPAKDLGLPGPYLANGSLGQFQIQVKLEIENTYPDPYVPEFVMVVVNSGIMTTIAGNSSVYSGLVNQQIAMETVQSGEEIGDKQLKRLIGGSLADSISSALLHVPVARKSLKSLMHQRGAARSGGKSKSSKLDMLSM